MSEPNYLAQRIRVAMAAAGLDARSLFLELGVKSVEIPRLWMVGISRPTSKQIADISRVTGASVAWLTRNEPVDVGGGDGR